jgi:hypothetical protein
MSENKKSHVVLQQHESMCIITNGCRQEAFGEAFPKYISMRLQRRLYKTQFTGNQYASSGQSKTNHYKNDLSLGLSKFMVRKLLLLTILHGCHSCTGQVLQWHPLHYPLVPSFDSALQVMLSNAFNTWALASKLLSGNLLTNSKGD